MEEQLESGHAEPSFKPLQLSLPLEHSNSNIHIHLSDFSSRTVLLFLSVGHGSLPSGLPGDDPEYQQPTGPSPPRALQSAAALGTFVYAIPSHTDPTSVLATPLYTRESSLDAITRVAKALARRLHRPVYVGGELPVAGTVYGGPGEGVQDVEEETKAMVQVVDLVVETIQGDKTRTGDATSR